MTHEELLEKIGKLTCCSGWHEVALRAVIELHKPYSDTFFEGREYIACSNCLDGTGQSLVYYPCPTIQAIERELNG